MRITKEILLPLWPNVYKKTVGQLTGNLAPFNPKPTFKLSRINASPWLPDTGAAASLPS